MSSVNSNTNITKLKEYEEEYLKTMIITHKGLKKLCETKNGPHIILKQSNECKNEITDDNLSEIIRHSFKDHKNFMWSWKYLSFLMIYASKKSTSDHVIVQYGKEKGDDRITILVFPYDQPEILRDISKDCVNVVCTTD